MVIGPAWAWQRLAREKQHRGQPGGPWNPTSPALSVVYPNPADNVSGPLSTRLRRELGPWHPAWLGRRASGLAPRQLHPVPIVGQQRRHVRAKAIGEKERGAVGSQDLHDLVDHALRHRERALSDVDRQQQLALGVHGHPDPLG